MAWRHDFHTHPELGFNEVRTAARVAELLQSWGIEVHRNIGRTGVVGVLRRGAGSASIGLRADMDALPITELNDFAHASLKSGVMPVVMMVTHRCCWGPRSIWRSTAILTALSSLSFSRTRNTEKARLP